MGLPAKLDRVNAAVAAAVWLTSLVIYVQTQAPTLSFWDCGEFIACSYILGIPHPPGTPTYILFGRLASMVPAFDDIAARVNLFSGVCSSIAALFAYLIGVRVLRRWFVEPPDRFGRFVIYAGAAAGALFLAFGRTQWNNAVEAEVYGMSMAIMFAIAWLTMIFLEKRETILGHKVLMLAVYLAFLGIGVHMTTLLILPITIVAFVLKKNTPARYWFILAAFFGIELYLIFALSSNKGEIPFYLPVVVCGAVFTFYMLSFERISSRMLLAAGGYLGAATPLIARLFGAGGSLYDQVGLIFFGGLTAFGLYLLVEHLKGRSAGTEPAAGTLGTAVFTLVTAALTGVTKLGLQNGPEGYHAFLLLTVILAISIGVFIWRYINLPILLALVGPTMIILGVREFFWGTLISAGLVLALGLIWKVSGWRTALMVIVMAVAGYSTHLFPPIRSSLDPYINENNPSESLDATINFYERKQYGSQSMTERMFKRRGEWDNQFGNHPRMGFWGFFEEQYGFPRWTFAVAVLLGMLGLWEACRRRPEMGVYLTVLLLVTTVGLVLYMNFADGARQTAYDAWLEVRDRDYFFTPGFMLFGLMMGLGLTAAVQLVRDLTGRFSDIPRRVIWAGMSVFFLLPVQTIAVNRFYCDRSEVYIPYDYAWNLLQSCEPNAVLLTFGDNDTFPLWCMQEVYGVRRDVKSVCCALANGTWYIKQIRDYMGLELGWTDREIDELRPFRTQDGKTFRLQDQVADAIIAHNASKRPIHFTLLANPGSRRYYGEQIDSLLEMRGLTYLLTRQSSGRGIRTPVETNVDLMMRSGRLQYRQWTDPSVYRDEMTQRSIAGVTDRFMALAEQMIKENRWAEAADLLEFVADSVDRSPDVVETLLSVVAETGDQARMNTFVSKFPEVDQKMIRMSSARSLYQKGDLGASKALLVALLEQYPNYRGALDELMKIYISERNVASMVEALETWMRHNPNDTDVKSALDELRSELERVGTRGVPAP